MYRKSFFKQLVIWLKRFRHRKGYGVHSPFAFNLITYVIYEKEFYYNYKLFSSLPDKKLETDKICKLLFRLTNFAQPDTIYYNPLQPTIASVFKWAKSDVICIDTITEGTDKVDLFYLTPTSTGNLSLDISTIYEQITSKSILILYGIGYNETLTNYWKELISHPKAGISFDLYDLGILFFDLDKNKQDYIVNFEF